MMPAGWPGCSLPAVRGRIFPQPQSNAPSVGSQAWIEFASVQSSDIIRIIPQGLSSYHCQAWPPVNQPPDPICFKIQIEAIGACLPNRLYILQCNNEFQCHLIVCLLECFERLVLRLSVGLDRKLFFSYFSRKVEPKLKNINIPLNSAHGLTQPMSISHSHCAAIIVQLYHCGCLHPVMPTGQTHRLVDSDWCRICARGGRRGNKQQVRLALVRHWWRVQQLAMHAVPHTAATPAWEW